MIYLCLCLLIVAVGLLSWVVFKNRKDIEILDAYFTEMATRCNKLTDNIASMAGKLAKYLDELDDLNRKVELLKENMEDQSYEELKDFLDKKWDDAVNDITNYDPFKVGEDK